MAQKKDNVDLICNIEELAGLFEKSRNLSDFLQTVVSVVAYHMSAAVCSVYILDKERKDLVLTANQGLNPQLVGNLRLRLGEGLTGIALDELRPIREGRASFSPGYKFIPGSNEEMYESFLAVPILRGLSRVGVLVVEDTQSDYFDENDSRALQAIASQLATTIENAKMFMSLYDRGEGLEVIVEGEEAVAIPNEFKGTIASRGLAWGRATVIGRTDSYLKLTKEMENRHCTLEEFHQAVYKSQEQVEALQTQLESGLADVASLIFSAHLLVLKDEQFVGEMTHLVGQGRSPQQAVTEVVNQYITMFAKNTNPRFQEMVQDIKDVGHRLLHNLLVREDIAPDYAGEVVISGELLPSDIVKFSTQHAAGLIMVGGGVTSHISILARSMELPVVLVSDVQIFEVKEGTHVLLDANIGSIFINPGQEVIDQYKKTFEAKESTDELEESILPETYTKDGTRIKLLANINLLNELNLAKRFKAEGIGLYRSEFPFIVRSGFPSEEEQYRIYRTIVDGMKDRPITLRTLDIGGDKMLSYFPTVNEANPFLGLRALRFTLRNKDIFVQQLRAMLRCGVGADLRIMFPMVSSVDEFLQACEIVHDCRGELHKQGIEFNNAPLLGPMIELPSAVEVAPELAKEADFLCIGTNDLVQYILAVDRTNEQIADFYVPYHPAVLRSLKKIAAAAALHDTRLSLCGEMATDPKMIRFLVGIGIREFSIDTRMLPRVQTFLQTINIADAQRQAETMLRMGRISQLAEYLKTAQI